MRDLIQVNNLIILVQNILILFLAYAAAKLAQLFLVKLLHSQRIFRGDFTRCIIDRCRVPLFWLLLFLALYAALPFTHLSPSSVARFTILLKPLSVAALGWLVVGITRGTGRWLELHYSKKQTRDSLGARRFTTQIHLLMRVVIAVIVVLTVIGVALVIPTLREFGMSLFASAGVAGIILGVAAKEALSNLIAGVQLALTQQILLGDEVIVEGEFGTIEEITSSYVVVKIWDLRRLIIPLRYFMENPFENWTYREPDLIGTVFLYADYTVDVDAVRTEAKQLVEASLLWDKKVFSVVVTDSKENVLELRILVSAANSSALVNLRFELREKMIAYLQRTQPLALPKARVHLEAKETVPV